jgi:hypothetical protein
MRRSSAWRSTSRAPRFSTTRSKTVRHHREQSRQRPILAAAQQQIEIRRGGTWLDYPIRGIIRGRWVIGDYAVNTGLSPAMFGGPEIVLAPKAERDTLHFGGRILDSLPPDVRVVTDAEVRRVQEEARALVRAQALRRPSR